MLKIKYIFDILFKKILANSISNMIIEAYANISHVFILPGDLENGLCPSPSARGPWWVGGGVCSRCVGGAKRTATHRILLQPNQTYK